MAKNQVTLTFAGDSKQLEKTFDNVGKGAQDMGRRADDSAGGIDRLGEAGGTTETRFLGLGAGISGVSSLLSGDLNAETAAMAMADLGDAVEHTIAPMLKHAQQWVTMGVTATVNSVKMAAAWLVSLGPIALVIAGVAAVIAIMVALGVSFDDFKNAALAVWNAVLGGIKTAFNWVKSNWPTILAVLTGPIGLAVLVISRHKDTIIRFFREIPGKIVGFFQSLPGRVGDVFASIGRAMGDGLKRAWNSTIGGRGIHIPSVGVGPFRTPGLDITIPRLHGGGIMPGAPGTEGLALLQAGERVTPASRAGGVTVVINVAGSIRSDRDLVKLIRDEFTRGGFRGAL
jgi:hypothetical protein